MAPNPDYEYGVDFNRKSDNASSGIRYIGRSEMVEFVCHGEDSKRKSSAKSRQKSAAKSDAKFAYVKSPRMRRKNEDDCSAASDFIGMPVVKPRRRRVTFNLDDDEDEPEFPSITDTCLPPIENKVTTASTPELARKSSGKFKPLKKAKSMDEALMTKLVPLESPFTSTMSSPKLMKRNNSFSSSNRKADHISIDRFTPTTSQFTPKKRFERVDSMLKKLELLNNSRDNLRRSTEVSKRTPPTSPRLSPRSSKTEKNLFVDLDNIDDYKPDRSRMKFIQAALSTTTSPKFIRPGSGTSSSISSRRDSPSGTSSHRGRSSPISISQISIDGDSKARYSCSFPELDSESYATGSRCSSPTFSTSLTPRIISASSKRSGSSRMQESITSLMAQSNRKWYD